MDELENLKKIAVHAKQLFLHASTHASAEHAVDRMIALHDMHNAVEWLVSGLWNYYFGPTDKPWSLMQMFDRISKEKQKLILKREIGMLNEARNQAQHHAIAPSSDALAKYAGYCEAFFRETLRNSSPECEYDQLTMGVLLPPDLDFRVETEDFPERFVSYLGGQADFFDTRPDSERGCRLTVLLNLRTMFLQAEKYANQTVDVEGEHWDTSWIAMNILASCLSYGQLIAYEGLRRVAPSGFVWNPDGGFIDPGSIRSAPFRAFGLALALDFDSLCDSAGLGFAGAIDGLHDVYHRVGDCFTGKQSFALQTLVMHLLSALEPISLGMDVNKMWRFEKLLRRAEVCMLSHVDISETLCLLDCASYDSHTEEFEQADLLWSLDFVFETLVRLTPMIKGVPVDERCFELDLDRGAAIFNP